MAALFEMTSTNGDEVVCTCGFRLKARDQENANDLVRLHWATHVFVNPAGSA
jgi:hypothetical protein